MASIASMLPPAGKVIERVVQEGEQMFCAEAVLIENNKKAITAKFFICLTSVLNNFYCLS
jgi:hypothetical protein